MKSKLLPCLFLVVFVMISCNDSISPEKKLPPEIPSLEFMKPDLEYFEVQPSFKSTAESYTRARTSIFLLEMITLMSDMYIDLLARADRNDAVFNDGEWIWNYSYTYQNISSSVKLTAVEEGNFYNWRLSLSYDAGEGIKIDDMEIIKGRTAKDGSEGNWAMSSLYGDSESPILTSDWIKHSDTHWESSVEYLQGEEVLISYHYLKEENENSLVILDHRSENLILIFWDTDTGTGYIQKVGDDTSRQCWDSNFQDVECFEQ